MTNKKPGAVFAPGFLLESIVHSTDLSSVSWPRLNQYPGLRLVCATAMIRIWSGSMEYMIAYGNFGKRKRLKGACNIRYMNGASAIFFIEDSTTKRKRCPKPCWQSS